MKRILLLSFMLASILASEVWAQDRVVSGRVTSGEDNSALPGVNIILKGTATGAVTDVDGNYKLSVPTSGGTLVFSFIGLATQEVEIGARSVIDLFMNADVRQLNELIIVTGQGVERSAKSLGYAAATIKGDELESSSQVDPMKSLQGKVPGVVVTGGGGAPGASTKVVIRGYSSILGGSNPLYVVDGTPINNSSRTDSGSGLDFGNRANDVNPNDIASMTILKGAAATNLYGPRGANGVVVITTKQGKANQGLKVDINSSFTVSDVLRLPQSQNTFGQGWSGHWADDENGSWGPRMDGQNRLWGNVVNNSQKIKKFAPVKDNIYDFYEYGTQFYNSVSVSGGSDKSLFYLSYSNSTTNGVVPTDVDKDVKNTIRLNAKTSANKLTVSTSLSYVKKDGSLHPDGRGGSNAAANLYSELLQIPRDISVVDMKDYNNEFDNLDNFYTPYAANPYFAINENKSIYDENRLYGNVSVEYEALEWLRFKTILGTDVSSLNRQEWEAIVAYTPGSYQDVKKKAVNPGLFFESRSDDTQFESDFQALANHGFGDISLEGYLGYNIRSQESMRTSSSINSLVIPDFYNIDNTDADKVVNTYREMRRLIGTYGNVSVGYRDYLFLELGGRLDKSSTLPKDNNSFFYPKTSLSFIVSDVLPGVEDIFSYLKFRASWGKSGQDASPYQLKPVFVSGDVFVPYSKLLFPLKKVAGFEQSNVIGNASLKPEITTESELGLQFSTRNKRIEGEISAYKRVSDGQILNAGVAPSSGFSSSVINFGKVENKGIELLLTFIPVQRNSFKWDITANYFVNRNKVYDLPKDAPEIILTSAYDVEYVAIEGGNLAQFRAPGIKKDALGRVIVNAENGMPESTTEKQIFGDSQSKYFLGITNGLSYKDFRLSFTIDYRPGGLMYSGTADLHYFVGHATNTTYNGRQPFLIPNSVKPNPAYNPDIKDSPEPEYIENDVPITMTGINQYYYHTVNPAIQGTTRLIPRTFLKLRDVNFSYTLPKKFLRELPLTFVQVYFSGRNLLLFTPESNNFVDPESTSYGNNLAGDFGEFRTGPTYRSFTFGLRATF